MAAQIPETAYERMTADERAKERLDRQKMLVSLPKGDLRESYLTFVAGLNVDVRESLEDMLLLVNIHNQKTTGYGHAFFRCLKFVC
jgi:hypothetical protein